MSISNVVRAVGVLWLPSPTLATATCYLEQSMAHSTFFLGKSSWWKFASSYCFSVFSRVPSFILSYNLFWNFTLILCINLLATSKIKDKYRECKLVSQVQKVINKWYLNITSWKKYHHNSKVLVSTLLTKPTRSTMIYSHIYPSTYEVRVQMILTKNVLVHILYENKDQVR